MEENHRLKELEVECAAMEGEREMLEDQLRSLSARASKLHQVASRLSELLADEVGYQDPKVQRELRELRSALLSLR